MINLHTFNNMNRKQNIQTPNELSNAIDCLVLSENDVIRTYLFETGNSFYRIVNETVKDDFIWPDDQIRIDFEEFIEYFRNDRELMINWLIETELEYIHNKSNEQALIDAINKIQEFDRRYMNMLLDNRKLINLYV